MDPTAATSGGTTQGQVEAGPFRVSIATFGPRLVIPSHFHERSMISVLLEGRFEQRFPGRVCDCPPGVVLAKPPGERHEDRWHDAPSRHLMIEIDPEGHAELGPGRSVAEQVFLVDDIGAEAIAWSAWRELEESDSVTPLAIEGLVLQLLARMQRRLTAEDALGSRPAWLAIALGYLHEHYRSAIRLSEVAAAAGVHPDHLARVFALTYDTTVGEYVRRLRVEAAASMLASSDEAISAIAYRTGFSDQSHLTRVFKRLKGLTPGRYRTEHRRG